MKQEFFEFDKFVKDLDERTNKHNESVRKTAEREHANRTRQLDKLYRDHHLSRTYVGDRND